MAQPGDPEWRTARGSPGGARGSPRRGNFAGCGPGGSTGLASYVRPRGTGSRTMLAAHPPRGMVLLLFLVPLSSPRGEFGARQGWRLLKLPILPVCLKASCLFSFCILFVC